MNETLETMLRTVKEKASSAGKTVEIAASAASQKTGVLIEQTKLSLSISEHQHKANKVLRSIGDLVYRAHTDPNTPTEKMDFYLLQLDEIHDTLDDLKEQYEEIRIKKSCKNCAKLLSKEDLFCRFCGTQVETDKGELL
jgi:serine/threonine protein phosphatase PrpC